MGWLMQVLSARGAQKSASSSSCALRTHGGYRSQGHRILTAHDSEFCFASCARPNRGLRAGPATPHRNRAYGHEISPQRGRRSPVRCLGRRPQAQGAPNTSVTTHSAAAVVGSDRTLALNIEMASSKVKSWGCVQPLCGAL